MLTVVCFAWNTPGYRSQYGAQHVNALAAMVRGHYAAPHKFLCVTNLQAGFDPGIELVRDCADFADIHSPHGSQHPSCYRRLRLFDPKAAGLFGERFVSLDLDTVIVDDVRPLWDRPEDFVIYRDPIYHDAYCGSMMLLTAGARPQVWADFDTYLSPQAAVAAGFRGSDQAWIRYKLGPGQPTWGVEHGVYSFRIDLKEGAKPLPEGARLVSFHGRHDPWGPKAQQLSWVRDHYPLTPAGVALP